MEPKIIGLIGGEGNNPPNPTPATVELVIGENKYNVNPAGDAIDGEGKVVKTKAELEILKTPAPVLTDEQKLTATKLAEKTAAIEAQLIPDAEIEIDEVKYKLNKDGAAVDTTGKVIKSKAEIKALLLAIPEAVTDLDYVSEIQKVTNLTITGENGQPNTYENTLPGITTYVQDVFKEGNKLGATQYEQSLISKYPILPSILEHLDIHGDLKDFTADVDYSKVVITDDENQHIDIYTKAKLAQGLSQAEITDMINYLKTDKKLKSGAETGLVYLKTAQTNKSTERAEASTQAKALADAEQTKYWNEVNKIVASKQIVIGDKKFAIPDVIKIKTDDGKIVTKTSKDFIDYIQKPLTFKVEGQLYTMTQLEYDEAVEDIKRTPHNDLFDAYRKFTKYDDSQLIAAAASGNVVKQIIKLSTKAGGAGGVAGHGGKIVLPIK